MTEIEQEAQAQPAEVAALPALDPAAAERVERAWMLCLFFGALALRLAYVYFVHPPDEYIWSDMGSYWHGSERWLHEPWKVDEWAPFYPFGTSLLLAGFKLVSGGNRVALLGLWALPSALVVPILMAVTGRLAGSRGAGRVAGLLTALYYPFVGFCGYFLSETPFTLCLALALLFTMRLGDTGRLRDALGLGLAIGVGAWCRPQILLAAPLLGLYWLTRRQAFPKVTLLRLLPIAAVLGCTLGVNAAFSHHHTGRWSIVSQNGATNRLFARCHNSVLKGHGSWFGLPPFGALDRLQDKRPGFWLKTNPVRGREIEVPHKLWDEQRLHQVADACVREGGLRQQLVNAGTDVILLWAYNVTWPDMSRAPQMHLMSWSNDFNGVVLLPPVLFAMFYWGLRREEERLGLLTPYMWTVAGTAAAYIGGTRVRTPFDTVMIVIAVAMYWRWGGSVLDKIRAWRAGRSWGKDSAP